MGLFTWPEFDTMRVEGKVLDRMTRAVRRTYG